MKLDQPVKKSLELFPLNLILTLIMISALAAQALGFHKQMSSPVLGQCMHLIIGIFGHWIFAWANYKNRFMVSELINMMLKFERNRNGKMMYIKCL